MRRAIHVAIACGGTGGHLFPGLAVARALSDRGGRATLLISNKAVDQQAVEGVTDVAIRKLPAVGLQGGNHVGFAWGFGRSVLAARQLFDRDPPEVVLAMGGFTSAPPLVAARLSGRLTALHESNTIPGRANRLLRRLVQRVFVGFDEAAGRFGGEGVRVTGTPVRSQFRPGVAGTARASFGLSPEHPVIAVLGGSQGATGLNEAIRSAVPAMVRHWPGIQFIHLSGPRDREVLQAAYQAVNATAVVLPFCDRVDLVLQAASVAVARSGASTLAEFAAVGVPAVLVPLPTAVDDHQRCNAEAFVRAGAARLLAQRDAQPRALCDALGDLIEDSPARARMVAASLSLHRPEAAGDIADELLALAAGPFSRVPRSGADGGSEVRGSGRNAAVLGPLASS